MGEEKDINILVNGKMFIVSFGKTVGGFLGEIGFNPERCVVEINLSAKKYADFKDLKLSDGDVLEVMSIVAGG